MKERLLHIIRKWPVFLWLLPVFFVVHRLTEYFDHSLVDTAIWLILIYIGVASLLTALFWLFYKDLRKAGIVVFAIMAFNFFFGSVYDLFKKIQGDSLLTKYSFILPAAIILLILLILYVRKTKRTFTRTTIFLNSLFLLLLVIDLVTLIPKWFATKNINEADLSKSFIACDTCARPDVYLITVDEYAGKTELQDIFRHDNSPFEIELKNRGFHVVKDTKSNYNWTVYSMASCLNMNYAGSVTSNHENYKDNVYCSNLIRKNNLLSFFKQRGYEIHNYSFFDLGDKPRLNDPLLIPTERNLITSQTFIQRLKKAIGFNFAKKPAVEKFLKYNLYCNLETDSLTRLAAMEKNSKSPRFIYSHFMMPHPPYFFTRDGKEADYNTLLNEDQFKTDKNAYLEYLLYTNKWLLGLIDQIKSSSSKEPIIILMSDHGFRQFEKKEVVDEKYYFMNLNAVLLPGGNYSKFYDGMTNVNQFRVILNTSFGQNLPLLKDSLHFIWEH